MRTLVFSLLAVTVLLAGCGDTLRIEGTMAGDCSDGADNDADGLFDCGDPGCTNAPVCAIDAGRLDAGPLPPGSDAGPLPPGVDGGPGDAGDGTGVVFPERDYVCVTPSVACMTTEPARTDAQRTVGLTLDMSPTTFTYLVSTLAIPVPNTAVAGFNYDGLDSMDGSSELSANCEEFQPDYVSLTDPLHVGVDNAYARLVPTFEGLIGADMCPGGVTSGCLDALFQRDINDGTSLLLVEVSGVDSFVNDASVTVTIYQGNGAPVIGGGGRPSPGQTFGTAGTLAAAATGDIFEGRLRVRFVRLDLVTGSGNTLTAPLQQAELRADISATALQNGAIGGLMDNEDIIAAAAAVMPGIEGTVRSVIQGIADVGVSAGDPMICDNVSYGMLMQAVTATRTP